ncbi:hypothetical protein SFRURICE_021079 [Spodoptera frugiperda]|nr:hypothetical protein SFRURICE_021079 [Spodoptera frugiperda]
MTNFYFNVRLVDSFKILDTYFLFSVRNKYFRRYIDLKYSVMALLGTGTREAPSETTVGHDTGGSTLGAKGKQIKSTITINSL